MSFTFKIPENEDMRQALLLFLEDLPFDEDNIAHELVRTKSETYKHFGFEEQNTISLTIAHNGTRLDDGSFDLLNADYKQIVKQIGK